jgi:hypothetical protein
LETVLAAGAFMVGAPAEAARTLGIMIEQVKAIFRKTGTHRPANSSRC